MKQHLDLNFTKDGKPFSPLLMTLLAGILTFLLAFMIVYYQKLKAEHESKLAFAEKQAASKDVRVSPALKRTISLAHETKNTLNIPWDNMLASLEKAQSAVPNIQLLSIQPKPKKSEVLITGVVDDFAVLADYIKALKAQAIFNDAALLNQRWEEAGVDEVNLNFSLAARWNLQ